MTAIKNKSMITNLQLIYCLRIDNRISEERKLYSYTKLIKSLHWEYVVYKWAWALKWARSKLGFILMSPVSNEILYLKSNI